MLKVRETTRRDGQGADDVETRRREGRMKDGCDAFEMTTTTDGRGREDGE